MSPSSPVAPQEVAIAAANEGEHLDAGKAPIDASLPARYAETMKRYSRLERANDPSMSSRVMLLALLGILFYYAIQGRYELRLWRARLTPTEYDEDYTVFHQ